MDKEFEGLEVITISEEEVKKLAKETGADEDAVRDFLTGKVSILELPR